MTRLLLTLALALTSVGAHAHDARSAAVEVAVTGSVATVHLAVSQAGLHHALESAAGHALDARDPGYRALVADHLRQTLRLTADGQPLAVGDIGLRLGDHQSDARFVVDLPEGVGELAVTVTTLDGVDGAQTVVRVRHDDETTRAVLSAETGQTVAVPLASATATWEAVGSQTAAPDAPTPSAPGLPSAWTWWLGLVGMVAALSLLAAIRRFDRTPAVA